MSFEQVVRVFFAEDMNQEQAGELREQLKLVREDPNYSIITNFPVQWVDIAPGESICANDASAEQIEDLREQMALAYEDPNHPVVVGFVVATEGNPRE